MSSRAAAQEVVVVARRLGVAVVEQVAERAAGSAASARRSVVGRRRRRRRRWSAGVVVGAWSGVGRPASSAASGAVGRRRPRRSADCGDDARVGRARRQRGATPRPPPASHSGGRHPGPSVRAARRRAGRAVRPLLTPESVTRAAAAARRSRPRWLSAIDAAIDRTFAAASSARRTRPCGSPPWWWALISSTNSSVGSAPLDAPSSSSCSSVAMPGICSLRRRHPHPGHRLVGLGGLGRVHVAQHLDHPADVDALADEDAAGDGAQPGVGVRQREVHERHLHRLLVVDPHVLEEADVDVVAAPVRRRRRRSASRSSRRSARSPTSSADDVDRVLPPRQHDDVVVVVVVVVAVVVARRSTAAASSTSGTARVVVEHGVLGRAGLDVVAMHQSAGPVRSGRIARRCRPNYHAGRADAAHEMERPMAERSIATVRRRGRPRRQLVVDGLAADPARAGARRRHRASSSARRRAAADARPAAAGVSSYLARRATREEDAR